MNWPKLYTLFCFTIILCANAVSQWQWTEPIQITTGDSEDAHPAFVKSISPDWDVEWLAFSRKNNVGGRDICLIKTYIGGINWNDSVFYITHNDSGINDYPCLARNNFGEMMLVWDKASTGGHEVLYSYYTGDAWVEAANIAPNIGQNREPTIAANDSGFGIVWINGIDNGEKIGLKEFLHTSLVNFEFILDNGGCCLRPVEIKYLSETKPMIMWAHSGTNFDYWTEYTIKTDSGWSIRHNVTTPKNIIASPKFYKLGFPSGDLVDISFQEFTTLLGSEGLYTGDSIDWDVRDVQLNEVCGNAPSFTTFSIVTQHINSKWLMDGVGSWESSTTCNFSPDSIALHAMGGTIFKTVSPGTMNQHPDVSSGIFVGGSFRVWSVWENNFTGVFKLYGSTIDVPLEINEQNIIPKSFSLSQNHPNPFNPSTRIDYELPKEEFVTMSVFDILGKEITTLVNEEKGAGKYSVSFNASVLPSGLYFYRLKTRDFVETKKLVLVK